MDRKMHAQGSFDKLRGFFAATTRCTHPRRNNRDEKAQAFFEAASGVAMSLPVATVYLHVG
jgi:hypothetical protein